MKERVLIVDDEPVNLELLEAILAPDGYAIQWADDGMKALAAVAEQPPDLILLDLMMPGMSGLEACRRLKEAPATAGIPIIVVTAAGQVMTKEAAVTSGADDFLKKPAGAEDLRTRVAAMLKVRRIRADLDRTLAYMHELEATRHARRRASLAAVVTPASERKQQLPTPMRVLLVEDDRLTRDFYGDLLAEHGFQVFAASTGEEGLQMVQRHALDAILLDIVLPGISGLEVLERIRQFDIDLPLIILTGHVSSQNAIAALKLGAFDFIVKGLDHGLVVLALHRAVRQRRAALKQKEEIAYYKARVIDLEAAAGVGVAGNR